MHTTTLTSKGQLVIPKEIRDSLHLRPGTEFRVSAKGSRIMLEAARPKRHKADSWKGFAPNGIKLSTEDLCAPVDLREHE